MKKMILGALAFLSIQMTSAQTLEKMSLRKAITGVSPIMGLRSMMHLFIMPLTAASLK